MDVETVEINESGKIKEDCKRYKRDFSEVEKMFIGPTLYLSLFYTWTRYKVAPAEGISAEHSAAS